MKERRGYVAKVKDKNGKTKLYARVTYTDSLGKRKNVKKLVESVTEGRQWLKKKVRELDDHGTAHLENAKATFNDLANYYEKTYLVEPHYVDGRKVSGMRTWKNARATLKTLRAYFGKMRLQQIKTGDIENFRNERLKTTNRRKVTNTIATVNRELALLRAMLISATREGFIIRNPFLAKKSLISVADERKRERLISYADEARLLAECVGRRAHLRGLIIIALDTGMRRGEVIKLKWEDVDLAGRVITIRAFNTKTMRQRTVAITARLATELESLYMKAHPKPDELVFGITDNFHEAFTSACKKAGLDDLRYHDLRHVAATRLIQAGLPREQVGRILGHTQANTTYRYINVDNETIRRAADLLDMQQSENEERETIN